MVEKKWKRKDEGCYGLKKDNYKAIELCNDSTFKFQLSSLTSTHLFVKHSKLKKFKFLVLSKAKFSKWTMVFTLWQRFCWFWLNLNNLIFADCFYFIYNDF